MNSRIGYFLQYGLYPQANATIQDGLYCGLDSGTLGVMGATATMLRGYDRGLSVRPTFATLLACFHHQAYNCSTNKAMSHTILKKLGAAAARTAGANQKIGSACTEGAVPILHRMRTEYVVRGHYYLLLDAQ
eukprot:scaffold55406_cov53-Attheya_sp.AAC.3